ncbi:lisH domain-containing protein FOPNL-like, partial [Limulus polyphemus]|uniref:LisH domain-containing protein FOPNL-like n=1 Tax=Limulus polyphemus TaxID=6850 RepID=A0ABM1BZQ4_LIMPO
MRNLTMAYRDEIQTLKTALKDVLKRQGILTDLKGRIRAELFNALENPETSPPALSSENFLINELIIEYLEFNGYKHTSSVLVAESGHPRVSLGREFLENQLHVQMDRRTATV